MICLKQTLFRVSELEWENFFFVYIFRVVKCEQKESMVGRWWCERAAKKLDSWRESPKQASSSTTSRRARCVSSSSRKEDIARADDEFFLFNLMLRSSEVFLVRSQSVVEDVKTSSCSSFSSLNSLDFTSSPGAICVFFFSNKKKKRELFFTSTFSTSFHHVSWTSFC